MDVVRQADWLVDVGPMAGEHGGRVLHSGPCGRSRRRRGVGDAALPLRRRPRSRTRGAHALGVAAAARGEPAQRARCGRRFPARGVHRRHRGLGLGEVDAGGPGSGGCTGGPAGLGRPGGAGGAAGARLRLGGGAGRGGPPGPGRPAAHRPYPRSNLATYTGLFDVVRKLFAATDVARERGYRAWPGSPSTWRAGGARPARARGSSRWSCCSCPVRTHPAPTATERGTTRRRSTSPCGG